MAYKHLAILWEGDVELNGVKEHARVRANTETQVTFPELLVVSGAYERESWVDGRAPASDPWEEVEDAEVEAAIYRAAFLDTLKKAGRQKMADAGAAFVRRLASSRQG